MGLGQGVDVQVSDAPQTQAEKTMKSYEGVFAAGAIDRHEVELAGAKEALDVAVEGAEGGGVGEVGLEGANQVVEESLVEVAGVAGATGVESVELVAGEVEGFTVATVDV